MLMTLSDDYTLASAEETEETSEDELAFAGGPADVETTAVEETVEEEEIQEDELMVAEAPMLMSAYSLSSDEELTKAQTPLDLVFILQTEGYSKERFEEQKQAVIDTSELVFNCFDDARISIIYFDYYSASWLMNGWFRDISSIEDNIDDIEYEFIARYCDREKAFDILLNRLSYRKNAAKFVFNLVDDWSYSSNFENHISICASEEYNYSEMWAEGWDYTYESDRIRIENLIYTTGGMVDRIDEDVHQVMYDHIYDYIVAPEVEYDAYYLSNWHPVSLNAHIDPEEGGNRDGGKLTDWKEINTELLSWDGNGKVVLPTVAECLSSQVKNSLTAKSPTEEGVIMIEDWMNTSLALPIFSNPQEPDSDGDEIPDNEDPEPLKKFDERFFIADTYLTTPKSSFVNARWNQSKDCYCSKKPMAEDWAKNLTLVVALRIGGVAAYVPLTSMIWASMQNDPSQGDVEFSWENLHDAADMLHNYLSNNCYSVDISQDNMKELISCHENNMLHLQYNINQLMTIAEETAYNSSISLCTTDNSNMRVVCMVDRMAECELQGIRINGYHHPNYGISKIETGIQANWNLAVGSSYGGMSATITSIDDSYTMKYRYHIIDIYEWAAHDKNPDNLSIMMHRLHEYGLSRQYLINGYFEGEITWVRGQRTGDEEVMNQILKTLNLQ